MFHRNRKKIIGPYHPTIEFSSNLFAVSSDGKYLYSGGIWDNSLRVFNTSKGKVVASVIKHFGKFACWIKYKSDYDVNISETMSHKSIMTSVRVTCLICCYLNL